MALMRFGPFPKRDIPKIEELLTKAGLKFEVVPDETTFERLEQDVASQQSNLHPTAKLDPSTLFVDVSDDDLEKIESPELEQMGFSLGLPVPDFHNQDFVCPKCELSQETPGRCPKDGETLLEFSDFVKHKHEKNAPSNAIFFGIMGVVVLVVVAYAIWG